MPNSGLRSGIGNRYRRYTPMLSDNSTPGVLSTFGTGLFTGQPNQNQVGAIGWYTVIDGMCAFHANFVWGSGGSNGSGAQYLISLPVAPRPCREAASGDFFIGAGMYGSVFGSNDSPVTVYTIADDYTVEAGHTAPGWCRAILGHYVTTGTAQIANAASSVTVTHNHAAAPDGVTFSPSGSPSASGLDMNHCWQDTIGATTFILHGQTAAAGNLTAAQNFNWTAVRTGGVILGPSAPLGFGLTSGDHIEIMGTYPTMNR